MVKSFLEFVESKKESNAVASRTTLGDNNEFDPFTISDDPNSEHYGANASLAPVVRAFKKGANWGWSKDDKTGEDKAIKISSKKLFLSGGAVRDHLKGKKPRNIELTTNASPDEIYHILKQNEFNFGGDDADGGDGTKSFWVMEKDVKGRPFKFGIRVKNDEFELSVFSANSKGIPGEFQPGNQEEDALSRDFTMNAMSLGLTNDNGPNKGINDFFGGMHHLASGQVVPIGDFNKKLEEDPMRALRYARMLTKYGDPSKVQDKDKEIIKNFSPKIKDCDRGRVVDEFMRLFNHEDGDSRGAMKIYGDLGILDNLFPNVQINKEFPTELKSSGDKHMPLAWMLKNNNPMDASSSLQGFKPELIKKVLFLIQALNLGENLNPDTLKELRQRYMESGVSTRGLKEWTTKVANKDNRLVDAFIQHLKSPRVKVYLSEESDEIHPDFKDLVNTFTKEIDVEKVEDRKKMLEFNNFMAILKKHIPSGE